MADPGSPSLPLLPLAARTPCTGRRSGAAACAFFLPLCLLSLPGSAAPLLFSVFFFSHFLLSFSDLVLSSSSFLSFFQFFLLFIFCFIFFCSFSVLFFYFIFFYQLLFVFFFFSFIYFCMFFFFFYFSFFLIYFVLIVFFFIFLIVFLFPDIFHFSPFVFMYHHCIPSTDVCNDSFSQKTPCKHVSSASADCVLALCPPRPSLLLIECSGELVGLQSFQFLDAIAKKCLWTLPHRKGKLLDGPAEGSFLALSVCSVVWTMRRHCDGDWYLHFVSPKSSL